MGGQFVNTMSVMEMTSQIYQQAAHQQSRFATSGGVPQFDE
jgi:hypothetical protein